MWIRIRIRIRNTGFKYYVIENQLFSVLWIRIVVNADPDQAFYLESRQILIQQCCGSGMFIRIRFFPSRIPDPGLTTV
jgi:hypothetical protein